jgi:purine-binding chemotaxis protein CheW
MKPISPGSEGDTDMNVNSRATREDDRAQSMAEQSQYLTFMLGGETFAIGILAIKEIIEYDSLTVVPMMPACVRGVINLRGAVVPVVDLAARFSRAVSDIGRRTCIVIVEVEADSGRQDLGVIVDAVNEVLEIPASEIEPAPAFGAGLRTDFIRGMGKLGGRFVILLDVDQVLSMDEMRALEDPTRAAATPETAAVAA